MEKALYAVVKAEAFSRLNATGEQFSRLAATGEAFSRPITTGEEFSMLLAEIAWIAGLSKIRASMAATKDIMEREFNGLLIYYTSNILIMYRNQKDINLMRVSWV
jgi:hypothetical protein